MPRYMETGLSLAATQLLPIQDGTHLGIPVSRENALWQRLRKKPKTAKLLFNKAPF